MTNTHHHAARVPFLAMLVATCAMSFCVASFPEHASAQGAVRRLGTRIREAVQQRGPLLQPPAGSNASPAAEPTDRKPATAPRSSNYNPAQTGPETAGPETTGPETTGPETTGKETSRSGRPGKRPSAATPPPPLPGKSSQSASASSKAPVVATQRPNRTPRSRLGLLVETPPPTPVPGRTARPTRGVLVVDTEPGSGSEAAGIRPGDLIVAIDGRTVSGVDDLVSQLGALNPGDPVELKFIRDKKLAAATAIMAGADGKLAPADHAAVKALAASESSSNSAPEIGEPPSNSTSAIGGLGRAIGGWLAGGEKTPALKGETEAAKSFEPLSKQSIEPIEGGVVQIDYESLRTKNDSKPLTQPSSALATDPPSLDQLLPVENLELLPPPSVVDAGPGDELADLLPATADAGDGTDLEAKETIENATIQSLLKELALLRRRLEQLEAEKAKPPQ